MAHLTSSEPKIRLGARVIDFAVRKSVVAFSFTQREANFKN